MTHNPNLIDNPYKKLDSEGLPEVSDYIVYVKNHKGEVECLAFSERDANSAARDGAPYGAVVQIIPSEEISIDNLDTHYNMAVKIAKSVY